jgi:hypothetical protein
VVPVIAAGSTMKTLAVYSIKGGVGKTTTAVNLAWLAAEAGLRTLVWDLDPQGAASFFLQVTAPATGAARAPLASPQIRGCGRILAGGICGEAPDGLVGPHAAHARRHTGCPPLWIWVVWVT